MNATQHPTTITAQPGTPFLDIERDFDATPEQVFRAMTEPELVVQWLGPRQYETKVDGWDVRPGGRYRFLNVDAGQDSAQGFRGVFHQVVPNELVIRTFEWEGAPNQVSLETASYTDLGDGRTRFAPARCSPRSRRSRAHWPTGWSGAHASRWTG